MYWMGDVLEPVRAVILEPEITFAAKLIAYEPTDADPAGLCQGIEACGHVDPVAKDVVVVVDYDVAYVDADPEFHTHTAKLIAIALGHVALHIDRAIRRIDGARKLDEQTVAGRFDGARAPSEPVRSVYLSLRPCYRYRSSRRAALRTGDRMGRPRLARPAALGPSDAGQSRRVGASRPSRRGARRT
jgi:hypothetical protein